MAAPHIQRDRVVREAPHDWFAALTLAHGVGDPWFRCQSLAWVARFASADAFAGIADDAMSAALACRDPYLVIAASAWPLRARVERGETARMDEVLARLLQRADTIAHPVSRLEGLFLLWQAIFALGITARRPVQEALIEACRNARSWKVSRTLRDMALIAAQDDRAEAARIVAMMRESWYRRQAMRELAAGRSRFPRDFFWTE